MSYFKIFKNFVWRYIRLKPLRFFLNILAVASGIALFVSINLVNDSILISLKKNIDSIAGKSEITITAGEAGFSDQILQSIEDTEGVLYAIPLIESKGTVQSQDKKETTQLTILGVDMLKEKNVRAYETEEEDILDDPLEFLNQPDSIIITREFANRFQLDSQDDFDILTVAGLKTFTVRGIMVPKGLAQAFGGSIALMDIDGASFSFGKQGKYDRIDIVTDGEHDPQSVLSMLTSKLGLGYEVELSSIRSENLTRVMRSFQNLLLVFGSLAWLIGLFLVYTSVNMSVGLRRREIGILRATGATRPLILFLFLGEGSIIGLLGGLFGVLLGRLLASGMLDFISVTMAAQFHTIVSRPEFDVSIVSLAITVVVSVVVAAFSAYWPAYQAASIHPLEAIRIESNKEVKKSFLLKLAVGEFLNMTSRFFTWRKWRIANLAARNLIGRLHDVFSNVVLLAMSLLFALFLGVTSHSMKTSMLSWMSQLARWDMIVTTYGDVYSQNFQPFTQKVAEDIGEIVKHYISPEQGLVVRRTSTYMLSGNKVRVIAIDPLVSGELNHSYFSLMGSEHIEKMKLFYSSPDPVIFISEGLREKLGKGEGDELEIDTPYGHFKLPILAVVRDYEYVGGIIYMTRKNYQVMWRDDLISSVGVKLNDSEKALLIKSRIENQKITNTPLMATLVGPFVEQVRQKIEEGFLFIMPLQTVAFLVAFLGLMSTLIVKILSRMRELGSLRAVGMDKGQVTKMLLIEGAIQAFIGLVWLMFCIPLLWIWIKFLVPVLLGWVVDFYFPWVSLGFVYLCSIVLALVSSYVPAQKILKEKIGEAIRYE